MDRFSDPVDEAEAVEQLIADKRIAGIRKEAAKIDTTNPSGECLWCGEEIGTERHWCDKNCLNDWEKDND